MKLIHGDSIIELQKLINEDIKVKKYYDIAYNRIKNTMNRLV